MCVRRYERKLKAGNTFLKETFFLAKNIERSTDGKHKAEYTDLDTFNVRRVEGLPSQPDRHQYDDRLPGLAGRIRGSLA